MTHNEVDNFFGNGNNSGSKAQTNCSNIQKITIFHNLEIMISIQLESSEFSSSTQTFE